MRRILKANPPQLLFSLSKSERSGTKTFADWKAPELWKPVQGAGTQNSQAPLEPPLTSTSGCLFCAGGHRFKQQWNYNIHQVQRGKEHWLWTQAKYWWESFCFTFNFQKGKIETKWVHKILAWLSIWCELERMRKYWRWCKDTFKFSWKMYIMLKLYTCLRNNFALT